MSSLTDAQISELIAAHRPGYSLAQPFYNSPAVFRRDMERIFHKQWIFAGHVAQLPNPGDFFLFNVGGEELIITRAPGRDGDVHALFNVCRHRGSRVCLEHEGNAKAFVCPYHAWTYAADGSLLGARAMPDDFDKSRFGLKACHVRVVEGLIFICLADTPPDPSEWFAHVERFFGPHKLADLKVAARMVWPVKANWKLVVENFGECYHCSHTHPEYCSVMAHATGDSGGYSRHAEEYKAFAARWESGARDGGHFPGDVRPQHNHHVFIRMPIRDGALTQSPDGQPVAPLIGEFKQRGYDGGYTGSRIFPANYIYATADHAILPRFTPIGPELTEVEFTWLVDKNAVEGVDYDVDRLTFVWRVTTEQDKKIVDDNQAGVNSIAYEPGPYSAVEQGLVKFVEWYLRQIG